MINLPIISHRSFLGKILRVPLKLIPEGKVIFILQGKLKGKKWIVGSSIHSNWLGIYEYEKQKIFTRMIKKGTVLYDIGAHVGFYTLLSSLLVGKKGKVIAFEPLPRNIFYLKRHLKLNKCENVKVIEAAVGERSGTTFFKEGEDSLRGYISSQGELKVKMVSLDELFLKGEIPPPNYMKIDVEGAELKVLLGAKEILRKFHPIIFLSTHSSEIHEECLKILKKMDYNFKFIGKTNDEILAY